MKNWWEEEGGFFGDFYMEGDNSEYGYLANKPLALAERTNTEVLGVEKILNLQPGSKILDLPCGYGRHSIGLAARGHKVLGLDINTTHLKLARAHAHAQKISVDFKKHDMRTPIHTEVFDAVINMFYSFGFFETDKENFRVLKNFYNTLKPGGKFLMHTDVNIPRIISGKYKFQESRPLTSGNTLNIIDEYDPKTRRINGLWEIKGANRPPEKRAYSVRVYSKEEFSGLCKKAGFKLVESYSGWNGEPYSGDSEDMIIVGTK